jgi:hypothetical protein
MTDEEKIKRLEEKLVKLRNRQYNIEKMDQELLIEGIMKSSLFRTGTWLFSTHYDDYVSAPTYSIKLHTPDILKTSDVPPIMERYGREKYRVYINIQLDNYSYVISINLDRDSFVITSYNYQWVLDFIENNIRRLEVGGWLNEEIKEAKEHLRELTEIKQRIKPKLRKPES